MSATKLGEPGARLQCPRKSRFYVCDKKPVRFVGCCNIDPCATKDGNCPQNELEPTGFERDAFPWLQTQWYTCTNPTPQFMGCCKVNPCTMQGCPFDNLRAARLSGKKENADVFVKLSLSTATPRPSTSKTAAASSTPQASSVTVTATPTGGPGSGRDIPQDAGAGTPPGTIAGTAVGSAIGAILILLFLFWLKRTMKRRREMRERTNPSYRVVQQPFQNTYPFSPESLGPVPSVADRTLSPDSHMCASEAASGQVTPLPANHGHLHFIPSEPVELPATEPANLASLFRKQSEKKAPKVDEGVEMEPAELADTSKPWGKESNPDKTKEQ